MSELQEHTDCRSMLVALDQPLIALPVDEDGMERVLYFTSEAEASAYTRRVHPGGPISYAGLWSDLDADEMLAQRVSGLSVHTLMRS